MNQPTWPKRFRLRTALGLAPVLFFCGAMNGLPGRAAALAAPPDTETGRVLLGDWAGWTYFDGDQGDAPLRLRIEMGDSILVRWDELTRGQYDLPATLLEWNAPRLVIERPRPGGQRIRLEGEVQDGAISGTVLWGDVNGRFELIRSTERIARIDPDAFSDLQGLYRLAEGRTLAITSRRWGELLYTDLGTGRQGTLFPIDRDRFFAGEAMYVPRPVEAYAQFARDDEGHVSGVAWMAASGETLNGERVSILEEEVNFSSETAQLSGTLLRPAGGARLPAAVVLGDFRWKERSNCRREAEILASFGMATLIFDRRGHGSSTGSAVHSFQDDASDARAGVRLLRGRADIIPDQVGLTGRSQGGWIAPIAAAGNHEVGFLLLFVSSAISPAEQEESRRLVLLSDAGFGASALSEEKRLLELIRKYTETGAGWEQYAEARRRAAEAGFPEEVLEAEKPDDPDWEWNRLNWLFDPTPVLERVGCPVLAVFGGSDRNVIPKDNLPRMRAAFHRAGNHDATLIEVPGANHALVAISPAGASVPLHRLTGIGNQGWPDVAAWLAARVTLGGVDPQR